ncbi:poly [ADP-ribose] polymerase tankyrase-2-like isoform X3 [Schistocerca gregaria]|nr:poly [ADP-ribose] polymerase tankyrase-2-like isoform X3 [Schistocerca gregaria]XP_049854014.1 poly [ADP-ribose] polymerase tankyrase-2-like isoform X3 [Schistocerca gregaria]XP_049854015.1 poly [ADP-ribose] polymerase tankyrase-2-like isoform X3 [Schistocerca gregaria]XP_049854016.1 poly [ADP-ribose] polymerase tankyrase-2-like isoform X3 [Schistocerca gregaria]XP_049854018.1 poly [ADP-ribose] polymerase tankyrase-2-like isoform X3 [Schistocerca gregaria]XP_049854019.1 poly [ADP-ribose] po
MAAIFPLKGRGGLSGDLGALLESKEAADVTLEVSGSQLLVHRAILTARSPVFRAKLRDITKESGSLTVQISDMKDEVMKQLLCFMYTDQVPDLCTYAAPLLVAADEYGIPLLKQVCEAMLAKGITVTNASEMAVLAVKHSCTKLKEVTINFIRTHNEVMGTNGWEDAILKHPRTVAQICRLMVAKPSEKSKEQLPSPDTLPSRGHLEEDMAVLLESGEAADVTLRVGKQGARMAAHRALLVARCPTLAAKQHVESTEPSVLTHVLRFLYTGQVALEVDSAGEMLTAAERFSLPELAERCERVLMEGLSVETAATAAVVAIMNCRLTLRSAAVQLIMRHAPQVMGTDGWKAALRNHTEVAVEICSLVSAAAAAAAAAVAVSPDISVPTAQDSCRTPGFRLQSGHTSATAVPTQDSHQTRQTQPPGGTQFQGDHAQISATPEEALPLTRAHQISKADPLNGFLSTVCSTPADEMNRRLLQAVKDGSMEELQQLLASGADVGMRDCYRMTALHWAAERGYLETVECLLKNGAEVDSRDRWQRTPLHRAAERGHRSVVTVLLNAGADREAVDNLGNTPLKLARRKDIRHM